LFDQDIFFPFGFPAGPELPRGSSLQMTWYLPQAKHDPSYVQHQHWTAPEVTRYRATCHGGPESEVPIESWDANSADGSEIQVARGDDEGEAAE
jgi:hypothetical protein